MNVIFVTRCQFKKGLIHGKGVDARSFTLYIEWGLDLITVLFNLVIICQSLGWSSLC